MYLVAKADLIRDVQGYADNMRQHYKHQPIVATCYITSGSL